MTKRLLQIILLLLAVFFVGVWIFLSNRESGAPKSAEAPVVSQDSYKEIDFSQVNGLFKFSAEIPAAFEVEFVPQTESLNIFDPKLSGTNLEKSQIFIRYFRASDFLTLATVNILSRQTDNINGHPAVRYEIIKKTGVPNFEHQPPWRSGQHKLIDIRLSSQNPSLFYVLAYNPGLPANEFETFINSLKFHNAE